MPRTRVLGTPQAVATEHNRLQDVILFIPSLPVRPRTGLKSSADPPTVVLNGLVLYPPFFLPHNLIPYYVTAVLTEALGLLDRAEATGGHHRRE